MTLDEAFEAFNDIAQRYATPKAIAGELTQDLDNLAYQIRRLAPQDTGRLRSSIALRAAGATGDVSVVLQMLDYGLYQNFGVNASDGVRPFTSLTSTSAPRRDPYGVTAEGQRYGDYSYNQPRRYGLPATVFFDVETLLNEIATLAEEGVFEAINDNL